MPGSSPFWLLIQIFTLLTPSLSSQSVFKIYAEMYVYGLQKLNEQMCARKCNFLELHNCIVVHVHKTHTNTEWLVYLLLLLHQFNGDLNALIHVPFIPPFLLYSPVEHIWNIFAPYKILPQTGRTALTCLVLIHSVLENWSSMNTINSLTCTHTPCHNIPCEAARTPPPTPFSPEWKCGDWGGGSSKEGGIFCN